MDVLAGRYNAIRVPATIEGVAVTPSRASVIFYDPEGREVSSDDASVSGQEIVIGLDAPDRLAEGWRLDLTTVADSGLVEVRTIWIDTVRLLLTPTLTDADLRRVYPRLDDKRWDGVTDWAWARNLAWDELMQAIRAKGYRPALIAPSSESLKLPHLHLTLSAVFRSLFTDPGDRWHARWMEHAAKADALLAGLAAQLRFDANQDGKVDPLPAPSMSSGCFELRR